MQHISSLTEACVSSSALDFKSSGYVESSSTFIVGVFVPIFIELIFSPSTVLAIEKCTNVDEVQHKKEVKQTKLIWEEKILFIAEKQLNLRQGQSEVSFHVFLVLRLFVHILHLVTEQGLPIEADGLKGHVLMAAYWIGVLLAHEEASTSIGTSAAANMASASAAAAKKRKLTPSSSGSRGRLRIPEELGCIDRYFKKNVLTSELKLNSCMVMLEPIYTLLDR